MCVVLIAAKIRNYSIVSVVNRRKVERICCILSESEAYYLIFVGCKRCFFTLIGYSADMCQSTCYIYSCSGTIYQNRKKGVACGSSRKLTQACGAFAGVPASFSQVCGSFAGVPASQLKRAGRLREFPQASRKCAGHLREFPQAHSSVRDVCGSSRKHALFLKNGIDFVRKTVRSLLDFTNFSPFDDIPLKPKEEAHIFF